MMPKTKTTKKKKTGSKPIKISAKHAEEEDYLDVTINDETLNCKIFQSGKIKFSFTHPDVGKSMQYEGLVEGDRLYLYPIVGEGVLTTSPVAIK